MQTFLPFPSFSKSAKVLDRRRLLNQRNEVLILLRALLGEYPTNAWRAHYVARMWAGYEGALADYGTAICYEAQARGTDCSVLDQLEELIADYELNPIAKPPWLGEDSWHRSMRAVLLYKDPEHYEQFHWFVQPSSEYKWPEVHAVQECQGHCRRFWIAITHGMCPFCAGPLQEHAAYRFGSKPKPKGGVVCQAREK